MKRFLSTWARRAATRLTSTSSHPPNAALPTCDQNGHWRNGSPQPHRSSSVMPRSHRCTSSPTAQTPGSCPISRSISVLPLRPRPPMYSTRTRPAGPAVWPTRRSVVALFPSNSPGGHEVTDACGPDKSGPYGPAGNFLPFLSPRQHLTLCAHVITICSYGSVGPLTVGHGGAGLPENLQVERERPVLHVPQVEPDRVLVAQVRPAVDLPESGHPGLDIQPAAKFVAVKRGLCGQRGPGPDQGHLAEYHVQELRELVQRSAAQEAADGRDPRVPAHLEQHPVALVQREERLLAQFRVGDHGAELQHRERLPILAHPGLGEERRTAVVEHDGQGDESQDRAEDNERGGSDDLVEQALDHQHDQVVLIPRRPVERTVPDQRRPAQNVVEPGDPPGVFQYRHVNRPTRCFCF